MYIYWKSRFGKQTIKYLNIELIDAVQHLKIPNFRGVFLRNTLPKRPNQKGYGILNLDSSSGRGTHWVAIITSTATEYSLLTK